MSTELKHHVAPEISRSWLLVTAARSDLFDASVASRADQVIIDLEDGVDPRQRAVAREALTDWLQAGSAWVRINDRTSMDWEQDVRALRGVPGVRGVMLAKAESPSDVTETFDRLGGDLPVIPLVESAVGIEYCTDIASARGAFRLAFGSGDYRRDTGTGAVDIAMAYPRSRLVVASRVAGLPGPIDGPTVSTSHPILREHSENALALGMTGRLCLSVEQLAVVNEVVSPTPSDIVWAEEFLAEFDARGREIRDGSDLPRLRRAEKIGALARELGLV
ncbi:CoA ester lyase [Microbacterium sp. ISL-103]|uniref:HpcH/HpaI aldolase/citrate lyase family protein n=1 Tax=Microbacterium sp. ISL-103 TaxID=2819156 RepID=UPI001BEBD17F|nr:CoA ester lyase [Microbacterium sp. ISL-103]MBT2473649.1 CoA ester lyase [Microbacterium sp. ISL-103]